jgi:HAE1 family hydrophobic/amphiphilic exporter-1
MNLTKISIEKPVMAWMLMVAMIGLGYIAYKSLGISDLPDVDFPNVSVSVNWDGAAAENVELDVIDPLEAAFTGVAGVKSMSSTAKRGQARINLEFKLNKDINIAVSEVQNKINQILRKLPTDVTVPVVTKMNADDRPILWLSINSKTMSQRELMSFVRDEIKDKFASIEGVSDVTLGGYLEPNVRLWIEPNKLKQNEMTVLDIIGSLKNDHKEYPAGFLKDESQELSIRFYGENRSIDDLKNLGVNRSGSQSFYPIPLKDLATVEEGLEDVRRITRVNKLPSIGLGIVKMRGSNTVAVGTKVKEVLQKIKQTLPKDMEMGVNYDSTIHIQNSIHELLNTLWQSALITALVCWFFLGSFNSTFNIILSIPTALMSTFLVLKFFGFTINTFTLLAITLAVGLVVDDNIMILENIHRHFNMGKNKMKAALEGTLEVSFAAFAAGIAIVAIFLPIGFMDGIVGKFFFQFAITISAAVMLSLVDALSLTPMRASKFLSNKGMQELPFVAKIMDAMDKSYEKSLNLSLRFRYTTLILGLIFFIGSLFIGKFLKKEFSPAQDTGNLMVRLTTPPSSSLEYTDQKTKELENILKDDENISRYLVSVGGFGGNDSNSAVGFLTLKERSERKISQVDVADVMREKLKNIKGAKILIQDPSSGGFGGGRGFPIEFKITGPNWQKLFELSQKTMDEMNKSGHFTDVDSNYKGLVPEIQIIPDRQKARLRYVSMDAIGQTLNAMVAGAVVGKFSKDNQRVDIKIKMKEELLKNKNILQTIFIRNTRGELVRLSEIATIEEHQSLQTIYREDRFRAVTLTANVAKSSSQSKALSYLKNELATQVLPSGYKFIIWFHGGFFDGNCHRLYDFSGSI